VHFDIEVLASGTIFEAGTSLRLDVLGHDAANYPGFHHAKTVNRGIHSIHTGGEHQSALLTPFLRPRDSD
jgi:predicted acyl esterase